MRSQPRRVTDGDAAVCQITSDIGYIWRLGTSLYTSVMVSAAVGKVGDRRRATYVIPISMTLSSLI